MSVSSSLGRRIGRSTWNTDEIHAAAKAAWHQRGVVMLRPDEIADEWVRQAVENEAVKLYGKRKERR